MVGFNAAAAKSLNLNLGRRTKVTGVKKGSDFDNARRQTKTSNLKGF